MNGEKNNTLEAITKSPLNMSKSKAMFTFTKANRFMEMKEPKYNSSNEAHLSMRSHPC
jgi:hypothetical protein